MGILPMFELPVYGREHWRDANATVLKQRPESPHTQSQNRKVRPRLIFFYARRDQKCV
jgi:hypothetical protein